MNAPSRRFALLLAAVFGCGPKPPAHTPPSPGAASVTDREWILATLGGCNRFSASYRLAGDSLSFGPVVSTKMSCADGDQLERSFLAMLPAIATYQATDSALTLLGPGGVSARFR